MDQFYFLFSLLLLVSTFMTISSYNPIHSVFWLVIVFLQSSILMMSLSYEFLGLMLIIIYVGAIAILFLFVIMMLDIFQLSKIVDFSNILPILFLSLLQISMVFLINTASLKLGYVKDWFFKQESQIVLLSNVLYNNFALLFLIISILLLIAMVGAMVLTLEIGIITRKQSLSIQHQRNNSWT